MKLLTLDEFLYDLTWSDNVRQKLRVMSDRDDLRYLVAWDNAEKFAEWLTKVAKESPEKACDIYLKAIEYHIPKLARTEVNQVRGNFNWKLYMKLIEIKRNEKK